MLGLLHSERFVDASPAQVWATLLDEGRYLASERTMYRLLAANGEVRERRDQLTHPAYARPELLAEQPNKLWSWDISKLKGPATWSCFHLYVILDVFSRYCVGWTVQERENAEIAKALIAQASEQETGDPRRSRRWPGVAARRMETTEFRLTGVKSGQRGDLPITGCACPRQGGERDQTDTHTDYAGTPAWHLTPVTGPRYALASHRSGRRDGTESGEACSGRPTRTSGDKIGSCLLDACIAARS